VVDGGRRRAPKEQRHDDPAATRQRRPAGSLDERSFGRSRPHLGSEGGSEVIAAADVVGISVGEEDPSRLDPGRPKLSLDQPAAARAAGIDEGRDGGHDEVDGGRATRGEAIQVRGQAFHVLGRGPGAYRPL
jgi:hypothetical protein